MAAEIKGFTIDGTVCEFATIDSFGLDEAQVLYDNTGLTVFDFVTEDGDEEALLEEKLKNPGFVRTLMHVAYQRKHPQVPAHKVKALIGKQSLAAALEDLYAQSGEDDALPPESTTEPEPSSPRSSVEPNGNSGDDSKPSSDAQVVPLTPTTTTGSGTSSTSPPASLVS